MREKDGELTEAWQLSGKRQVLEQVTQKKKKKIPLQLYTSHNRNPIDLYTHQALKP